MMHTTFELRCHQDLAVPYATSQQYVSSISWRYFTEAR